MSRRLPLLTFACSSLIVLAACGGDSPTGPDTQPTPSLGVVSMTNNANKAIIAVYIASCSVDEWGENRLGAGQSIAPGGTRTFAIAPGCYDVRASTGDKSGMWWDHTVQAGKTVKLALSSAANSLVQRVGESARK
jgi:hypothetical protein